MIPNKLSLTFSLALSEALTPAAQDGVQDPSFVLAVQTGLPKELAESLTRATQPGLESPDGCDQAQRYHPESLSASESSGESLRDVGCYSAKCVCGSRPKPSLSLRLSLSRSRPGSLYSISIIEYE
jgi:hypothetical protein